MKPNTPANAQESEAEGKENLEFEAEYALEAPVKCPLCKSSVKTLNVLRMLRSRVNFTSNLPRRGWVAACPSCHGIVTVGVASLLTS
ncbi:MAG TPA: hypothetical protein VGS03_05405 [Candidatus Polarisedimenticolia bacterium]|jgi:hypothetical protein|nr:hypothetical protein [Candidatus Polarisedimenticolia bacterium]